jgi:hypothetical protein
VWQDVGFMIGIKELDFKITPWFGIDGAMFTYSLAMALDKFIYKKND